MRSELNNLPKDVLVMMALDLDLAEVISLCRSSSKLNSSLCKNKNFWIRKLQYDFEISYDPSNTMIPKDYYNYIAHIVKKYPDIKNLWKEVKEER